MSNEFRLDDYLARIGFRGSVEPDLASLARLHAAHVDAIPFEGIDPLLGRPVNLDLASVQAKLVDSRRGGYCFEQNTLFKAALDALGFKVTGLSGRVRWMSPPDSPPGPREHMMLAVDLPEGRYLADVGFRRVRARLSAAIQARCRTANRNGHVSAGRSGRRIFDSPRNSRAAGGRCICSTSSREIPSDYQLGNWYTSTHPSMPFLNVLIMERLSADRRYKLVNRRFAIEARDGEVAAERELGSAEELRQVLDETFGVTPPVPVEEIFARTADGAGMQALPA